MILACNHVSKSFGEEMIFQDAVFTLEDREKAAIVGINGAGKSTLLKTLTGEYEPDTGNFVLSRGKTMGYLAQNPVLETDQTIYDTLLEVKKDLVAQEEKLRRLEQQMSSLSGDELSRCMEQYSRISHDFQNSGGFLYRSEITGVLKGLGFTEAEFQKPVLQLSGGQRTRVFLGRLLLQKPDLLLLDEPTNHLDLNSIVWLETFLINYPGSVLIVAHDRYFMDRIVTKIIEIDRGKVSVFTGNYSAYSEKKAMIREAERRAYLNQQAEIRHQEAVIEKLRSFNREKSIKRAESREKMLNKIEVLEKPTEENAEMVFTLTPAIVSGGDVLQTEDLAKSYGSHLLFQGVALDIKRGERVAIIGDNGTGKTTLLKILTGNVKQDAGSFRLGTKVHIGYYDQEHQVLHNDKTIFEEIQDEYPEMTGTQIRNMLAAFLFTGDDVFKPISLLSGGERGRVSLAKLMLSHANFLILDEPTNHLDMVSKEILENALNAYTGTLLYVSHDRYFINRTATRILDLRDGQFHNYIGNYDYYLEKRQQEIAGAATATVAGTPGSASSSATGTLPGSGKTTGLFGASSAAGQAAPSASQSKQDWLAQKEEQARERKRQNDLKKTEERIELLENRLAGIDEELTKEEVFSNPAETLKYHKERQSVAEELEELYAKWEELA